MNPKLVILGIYLNVPKITSFIGICTYIYLKLPVLQVYVPMITGL